MAFKELCYAYPTSTMGGKHGRYYIAIIDGKAKSIAETDPLASYEDIRAIYDAMPGEPSRWSVNHDNLK